MKSSYYTTGQCCIQYAAALVVLLPLRLRGAAAAAAEQRDVLWRLLLRTGQLVSPCWAQLDPGCVLQRHPSCDQHATRWHQGLLVRQPGSPLSATGPPERQLTQLLQVGTLMCNTALRGLSYRVRSLSRLSTFREFRILKL